MLTRTCFWCLICLRPRGGSRAIQRRDEIRPESKRRVTEAQEQLRAVFADLLGPLAGGQSTED